MTDESDRKLNEHQRATVEMLTNQHAHDLNFLGIDANGEAFYDWEHLRLKVGVTGSHSVGSVEFIGGPN